MARCWRAGRSSAAGRSSSPAADLTRWFLEDYGWLFFSQGDLLNAIPNLRLILFGGLIIFFLVVEPEGLNRLWRNIRNYFRVWPFSY
jgi:branched-chain amino acid transport system permease protein